MSKGIERMTIKKMKTLCIETKQYPLVVTHFLVSNNGQDEYTMQLISKISLQDLEGFGIACV